MAGPTAADPKDPWRALSRTVKALGAVIAVFFLLTGVLPLFQSGDGLDTSIFGYLSDEGGVCMHLDGRLLCDGRPGFGERLGVAASFQLGWVFLAGALFLLRRILRGEARQGTFSARTVGRFRFLGWYLIVGEAALSTYDTLVLRFFGDRVRSSNVSAASVRGWLAIWHPSWLVVLVGIALIAFARVVRVGAAMRQDLEATI